MNKDIESYLARIKKTIEASNRLVSQAELRIAETDRMLERQGLTREQVLALRFSQAQRDLVNDELRRRGLPELEEEPEAPYVHGGHVPGGGAEDESMSGADELAVRRQKFGMMMKPFQI